MSPKVEQVMVYFRQLDDEQKHLLLHCLQRRMLIPAWYAQPEFAGIDWKKSLPCIHEMLDGGLFAEYWNLTVEDWKTRI